MPGPGGYEKNDHFGKNGKKYTMGEKRSEMKGPNVPGPGTYDSNFGPTKDRSVTYKMGNGQQRAEAVSPDQRDMPGPGNYDSPTHFGKKGL